MSDLVSVFGSGKIKSIQRGSISIVGSAYSGTATVAAVDPTKSLLNFLGFSASPGADIAAAPWIVLTNPTTVTAGRGGSANSPTTTVSFQLVEYY